MHFYEQELGRESHKCSATIKNMMVLILIEMADSCSIRQLTINVQSQLRLVKFSLPACCASPRISRACLYRPSAPPAAAVFPQREI